MKAVSVFLFFLLASIASIAASLAVFDCREIVGRDWSRTMVTYPVQFPEGKVKIDEVRLVDNGGEHPCQFSRVEKYKDGSLKSGRISFYAELPKYGSYHFELQPGKPVIPVNLPVFKDEKGILTIDNGITAISIPAGKQEYKNPLIFCKNHKIAAAKLKNMAKAGLAFGPVTGIRLSDGRWVGGSYFSYEPIDVVRNRQKTVDVVPADAWEQAGKTAPCVTGYETAVTEQGPLFIEAHIRFTFTNGGYYQMTVRVLTDDPAIRVDEMMDLITTSSPDNPLYVNLILNDGSRSKGWRPDCVYGYSTRSDRYKPLEDVVKAQGIAITTPNIKAASLPIKYDTDDKIITDITALYPWGPYAHYAGIVDTAQLQKNKNAPFLGIVPQHGGSWRGSAFVFPPKTPQLYQQMISHADGDVEMRWTIRNQPHVQNLLHTGEYDPDFGLTGMRRIWNLVGGLFQYQDSLYRMRAVEGYVNLDNYKDWNISWTDDTKDALYQRPEKRVTNSVLYNLNSGFEGNDDRGLKWWSHFRQAENMAWAAKLRQNPMTGENRAQVAAFCYMMSEPDFNTRASASHQGNPNMPVNRFYALPFAAVLIPDHPMAKTWMNVTREYMKYELGLNLTPGNGYSELMTYYGAAAPTYIHAALVCKDLKSLTDDAMKLALGTVDFTLAALPPPDPRYGFRVIPGFGHEGILRINQWLPAAALVKSVDPELANVYAWAWKEQGEPGETQHCNGFSIITAGEGERAKDAKPEKIAQLIKSTWLPGFGAILHSHHGDPQETYLGYRQGFLTSHSDSNQGDFVLYAKGAPITSLSQFGYALVHQPYRKFSDEFGWHSVARTGSQTNNAGWPGGGPVSGIHRHFFSESVDYLRGIGDYSAVGVEGNSIARNLTAPDTQRWTRQIIFLKGKNAASPNYFIFRDSFRSLQGGIDKLTPKWWYQRTIGTKEQVKPTDNGFEYTSAFGPLMNVNFLQPGKINIESRTVSDKGPVGGGGLGGSINPNIVEELTVTAAGPVPAGEDIMAAIYPRGKNEAIAEFKKLADGVACVKTPESTDYIFVNPEGISYGYDAAGQNDVKFKGIAGAVRIYPDEVHLVIGEGAGEVAYKGFVLKSGKAVTKVITMENINKGGSIEVPADNVTITFNLNPADGAVTDVETGVTKQKLANGEAWLFNATTSIKFSKNGIIFEGKRGGIVVDTKASTTRLVMLDGTKISYGSALAEVADGPYDLTFYKNKVTGIAEGPARFLYISKPAGLNAMPCLNVDGIRYAPGLYSGNDGQFCKHINAEDAIVPLLGGRRTFTLENLPQPPVFRSWQLW